MNPKMFNSFLCGDKSAIEMCAVSNAANLKCPSDGLTFPPVGVYDIAKKMIPKNDGGLIDFDGQVEVISSIDSEKKDIPNDLRWGVYIVIKAKNEYDFASKMFLILRFSIYNQKDNCSFPQDNQLYLYNICSHTRKIL